MKAGAFEIGPSLDRELAAAPDRPAVFLIWPKDGAEPARPYLSRTGFLRRRLKRLLGQEGVASRRLNLRDIAGRGIDCRLG